jgi:hypothetical protein
LPLATWHRSRDARLQKLYGYDTASQLHDVSNFKAVIKAWEAAQSMNKLASSIKTTPMEELAINFLKYRLQTGCSFVIDNSLVELLRSRIISGAPLTHEAPSLAFWGPLTRPRVTRTGDVLFTVVDSHPEREKSPLQQSSSCSL